MDRKNNPKAHGLRHYVAVIMTIAMIVSDCMPVFAATEDTLLNELTVQEITEGKYAPGETTGSDVLTGDEQTAGSSELVDLNDAISDLIEGSDDELVDEPGGLIEDEVISENAALSDDKILDDGLELFDEDTLTDAEDITDVADGAVNYDISATQTDFEKYPGVYIATLKNAATSGTKQTIGIPSVAKQNLDKTPTTESPAIVMGAAMPYERKTGPTEFTPIPGGKLYAPYSYFRYQIIEEANLNGTGGTHKKMSGFDGTYLIIRVDVKNLIQNKPDGSYLHVRQTHNKALMTLIGQTVGEGSAYFSDAMGNMTGSYLISNNKLVARDKDGQYKDYDFIDVIFLSSGTLVQGADTGSSTPDPKAPTADFPLDFYIDNTGDYDTNIEWNSSLGTAVNKTTGEAITLTPEETSAGITASDKVLAKYFDEKKAAAASAPISGYTIKGSDVELEMMVESEETAPTETGKTEYWSLTKGMGYELYNDRPLKLICEAPLLNSISLKGDSARHVILDVYSFDIQLANHSQTGAAALCVDGATLTIQDSFKTTGAELAVGNNATMEIKNGGRLIIADSAQLEVEYDAASVSANSTTQSNLTNGVITVNTGGVIQNDGIITVEGKEGKPQNPGDVVVRDYMNARLTIGDGGTLENNGCLLVNGELYNFGTIRNTGRYTDTITSNDPDKGTFTYHKGIQLSWKDDITQGHTFPGEMYNGVDDTGKVYSGAKLENSGDLVMIPGYLDNYATINNSGNIYMGAVDEVVIPITAYANKPLVTERRLNLGYFENSYWYNESGASIINSGNIETAEIEIISNGRTGNILPRESRNKKEINIRSYGTVQNTGKIAVNALYAFSSVTNSKTGVIERVIIAKYDNYTGRYTDSSKTKESKVYNAAMTKSGSTYNWEYAPLDSLRVSDSTRAIKNANPGSKVKWSLTAGTDNPGNSILYSVAVYSLNPYEDIAVYDVPANKAVDIESPKLPDIDGNAVYEFISDGGNNDDYRLSSDAATVMVKGSGIIKPAPIKELVYNGKEQELVTLGSYKGGKIQYRLKGASAYSDNIPKAKNAGTYDVEFQAIKNNGVEGEGIIRVTIAKREAYIAADDIAMEKGSAKKELTWTAYGVADGDDLGISAAIEGTFDENTPGRSKIKISYNKSNDSNYSVVIYDGTYTVMETAADKAPEIKVQAVLGAYDNIASGISINTAYKPADESRVATIYYSLEKQLDNDNYKTDGTTVAPTYGGIGTQLMYYYIDTPDGSAYGSKPVVKIKADQKKPDASTLHVIAKLVGQGGAIEGLVPFDSNQMSMEYRRSDEFNYTRAIGYVPFVTAGNYYVRWAGDERYNPSPDVMVSVVETDTMTARFNTNGGSAISNVTGLTYGAILTEPADPVRSDYEFDGWYADSGLTEEFDFMYPLIGYETYVDLYAKWKRVIPGAKDDDADDIRKDAANNLSVNKTTVGTVSNDIVKIADKEVSIVSKDKDGKVTITSSIWIGGLENSYTYTGLAIKPEIRVYDGVKKLTEKTDYTLSFRNNKNAAGVGAKNAKGKSIAPTIILKFKGNYSGNAAKDIEFNIVKADLAQDVQVQDMSVLVLKNNKAQKPVPEITMISTGKKLGTKLFNYKYTPTVSAAGIYKVTVTPNNPNYTGKATATITVVSNKNLILNKASVSIKPSSYVYTGKEVRPAYSACTLKLGGRVLSPGVDYEIKDVYNNIDPGTATIVFSAVSGNKAGYAGTRTATFKIKNGRTLTNASGGTFRYIYEGTVPYAKGGAKPEVKVYDGSTLLKEKVDYTVAYSKNRAFTAGNKTAIATVKGKGRYKGKVTLMFAIDRQDINELDVTAADQFIAAAKYKTAKITVYDLDGKKLGSKDFNVTGTVIGTVSGNKPVYVTVSVNGLGNYKGTKKNVTFRLMDKNANIAKAGAFKIADQAYTGEEITLSRNDLKNILYTGNKKSPKYLKYTNDPAADEFEIVSYTNNLKKGTAKVTVRGINGWGGTKTLSFKIVQKRAGYKGVIVGGKWR